MSTNLTRRKLCQSASVALIMLPAMTWCPSAQAKTNQLLRDKLKYQSDPNDAKNCGQCLEFIPSGSDRAKGACKLIPDDDEIAVNGYCVAWNTM